MNLFYLDKDLDKCAEYHVDKHVNKMILEAAQPLCTAIWVDRLLGFIPRALEKDEAAVLNEYKKVEKPLKPEERKLTPYLGMMYNHPCTIWTGSSLDNYEWTWCYAHALAEEFRYRYGKEHKSFWQVINKLPDPINIERVGFTTFGLAMPDVLKTMMIQYSLTVTIIILTRLLLPVGHIDQLPLGGMSLLLTTNRGSQQSENETTHVRM